MGDLVRTEDVETAYPIMINAAPVTSDWEASILKRHKKLICHMAKSFAKDRVSGADFVQEGCLALLEAIPNYRPETGASLWTYAHRFVFASMVRLATAANRQCLSLEDELEEPSFDPSPESVLEKKQMLEVMTQQFSLLGEQDRAVLRLRFIDGLDVRGIAKRLGIPRSTASDLIQNAIEKLRNRVGDRL